MPSMKELREQGAKLATEIRQLGDLYNTQNKSWKDDQEAKWKDVNKRYDDTKALIETETRNEEVSNRLNELKENEERGKSNPGNIPGFGSNSPGGEQRGSGSEDAITEEMRAECLAAWVRTQMDEDISERQADICQRMKFNPARKKLEIGLPGSLQYRSLQQEYRKHHRDIATERVMESRAMSSFTAGKGGAFVPASFLQQLEINMLAFGGILQVADTLVTSTGEPMTWPGVDDTGNIGEQIGESAGIGSSVDPQAKAIVWNAYKFSSKAVLVPYELMRDSAFDLVGLLGQMLGERLGRILAQRMTVGSGAATCKGIVTAAQLGVTADSATAIKPEELIELEHSIDPAYRNGSGYMLHDTIVEYLRKLKDAEDRYVWGSGIRDGKPDTINGRPVTISMEMDDEVSSGKKTVLFGQLSKYKRRRVNGVRLYRLEERYRDQDQDGFVAFVEEDGNLLDMGTCPVKYLQQA